MSKKCQSEAGQSESDMQDREQYESPERLERAAVRAEVCV